MNESCRYCPSNCFQCSQNRDCECLTHDDDYDEFIAMLREGYDREENSRKGKGLHRKAK